MQHKHLKFLFFLRLDLLFRNATDLTSEALKLIVCGLVFQSVQPSLDNKNSLASMSFNWKPCSGRTAKDFHLQKHVPVDSAHIRTHSFCHCFRIFNSWMPKSRAVHRRLILRENLTIINPTGLPIHAILLLHDYFQDGTAYGNPGLINCNHGAEFFLRSLRWLYQ